VQTASCIVRTTGGNRRQIFGFSNLKYSRKTNHRLGWLGRREDAHLPEDNYKIQSEGRCLLTHPRAQRCCAAFVLELNTAATETTLADIMEATGWQKHTMRGFGSILGSKGAEEIESSKNAAGERSYRIAK
jgi:hypothetical protein